MRSTSTAQGRYLQCGKLTFAAVIVLASGFASPSSTAYATKKPNYGTIKILTTPGGFPIEVDGKPRGHTTSEFRAFDLDPGIHILVISLPDGQRWTREINLEAGRIKCVTLNYKPPLAPPLAPPAKSPCPFLINLSVPSTVNEGEVITYTSNVTYGGSLPLNFTWTISPANASILSGAGKSTIAVDSTGLGGQTLTATLVVDDGSRDPACSRSIQASTFVVARPRQNPAREFDVCYRCSLNDQKARLDNLAVELKNDPSARVHILAYGGRTSRRGQAKRLGARARDYLVTYRGIDASRIVVLNSGYREEESVELWIVPSGAAPPQLRPTIQSSDVRRPRAGMKAAPTN